MKIIDSNGNTHNWPPKGHQVELNDIRPRSELHLRCRSILRQLYPTQRILEEVPLIGEQLFLDFYLPHRRLAIECHGEQHYKFVPHFHGDRLGFAKAKARDVRKKDWCINNGIIIIELSYEEDDNVWRDRIQNADSE